MTIEPPQPPTAPAPAVRPTPPTPPRIDMAPFGRDKGQGTGDKSADEPAENVEPVNETAEPVDKPQVERKVDTPETMARDAVANGAGALTKRTVNRDDDNPPAKPNQTVTVIPPAAPLVNDGQSDYDRGKDVLRQFQELDAQQSTSTPAQTSTEQPTHIVPKLNYHEGNGGVFWIFTIIFVVAASFVVVKKFLLTDKPALTKSQLFEDSSSRLRAVTDKVKPAPKLKATVDKPKPAEPPPKPAPPPKKDDGKGKHFEIRV